MITAAVDGPRLAGPAFYAIATVAVAIAAWGVARRLRAWRGVHPRAQSRSTGGHLVARIALNTRLRRISRHRWGTHLLVAGGMAVLFFVGSVGDALDEHGIVHLSKDNAWFGAVNNLAGVAVLAGVLGMLDHRLRTRRPDGRRASGDLAVLVTIAVLVVTGFAVQEARHALGATSAGYKAIWWGHALLALGAIAAAPFTKLRHVFATPVALATGATGSPALAADACTQCDACSSVCEAFGAVPDPAIAPSVRMRALPQLLGGSGPVPAELEPVALGTFRCTTCARCTEICSAGIDLVPLWKTMRADLAARGVYPAKLDLARNAVRDNANVLNYPNDDRALWVELLDDPPDDEYRRDKAEVLYFVGCMSSFSPSVQSIPQAFAGVLTRLGVDFTILGADESCCGFPLVAAGRPDEAAEVIAANLAQVRAVEAKTVVFTCPSCYDAWHTIYGPELPGVRLQHAVQFLAEVLPTSGVALDEDSEGVVAGTVTYHDPCDLGRNNGVYDEPRQVLRLLDGLDLREPGPTRETGHCCGGGGDLEITDNELVKAIADRAADALAEPGAKVLATACPQCKRTLAPEVAKRGMRTFDVVELVWAGMGGELS